MTKWVIFFTTVYLFGIIFGGLMEGSYLGSDEASLLEQTVGIQTYHVMGITIPRPSTEWVGALGKMMLWEYAFFRNPDGSPNEWAIVKWLIFLPISVGLMYTFAVTFIPILIQGVKAVKFW